MTKSTASKTNAATSKPIITAGECITDAISRTERLMGRAVLMLRDLGSPTDAELSDFAKSGADLLASLHVAKHKIGER